MIDWIIHIIDSWKLNRKDIGLLIFYLHFIISFVLAFIIVFTKNRAILLIFLILTLLHHILYIIYQGCVLTKLEYKLTNIDHTIVDPFIDILGLKRNNRNRHIMTLIFSILTWIILIYKLNFI